MYTGSTRRQGVARLVEGWGALAQRYSTTIQAGLDPAWWVGEARERSTSSLCEAGGPESMIYLPQNASTCAFANNHFIQIYIIQARLAGG